MNPEFLPATPEEMKARGWSEPDILLVTGEAYVDHPSFGAALIGRCLEAAGYRVAVLPLPDWRRSESFAAFGRPRLMVGITAGSLDSMLANRSPGGGRRKTDAYAPGGRPGLRPDRAAIVYANRVREALPGVPILLGGIEASLRRLAHYDFWSDRVRRSILLDSRADWIAYGMAETAALEIAGRLAAGARPEEIRDVRGTVWATSEASELPPRSIILPGESEVMEDPEAFNQAFRLWYRELDPRSARPVVQPAGNRFVVQLPPPRPLAEPELDGLYRLPFTRRSHPRYDRDGGVPALRTVETSVTSHRGCGGGCSFCTLSAHQGRLVQSRSPESVREEVAGLAGRPGFSGTISDIGGPTANMYGAFCRLGSGGECRRDSCLHPSICPNFAFDHRRHLALLESARRVRGVRHVFVGTGVRHDLVLADPDSGYLDELCRHYVGGQLKVAPEHVVPGVLKLMHKPEPGSFERFKGEFEAAGRRAGRKLYLVPYFISGHPGCTVEDMVALAGYLARLGHFPEQVQEFLPLPMTLSAAMYWTGRDPFTGKPLHVARGEERRLQRALLQPADPRHRRRLEPLLRQRGKAGLLRPSRAGQAVKARKRGR